MDDCSTGDACSDQRRSPNRGGRDFTPSVIARRRAKTTPAGLVLCDSATKRTFEGFGASLRLKNRSRAPLEFSYYKYAALCSRRKTRLPSGSSANRFKGLDLIATRHAVSSWVGRSTVHLKKEDSGEISVRTSGKVQYQTRGRSCGVRCLRHSSYTGSVKEFCPPPAPGVITESVSARWPMHFLQDP